MVSPINMVVSNKKNYMAISYRLLYELLFSLYFFIYFFHFKQNGAFWVSANFFFILHVSYILLSMLFFR